MTKKNATYALKQFNNIFTNNKQNDLMVQDAEYLCYLLKEIKSTSVLNITVSNCIDAWLLKLMKMSGIKYLTSFDKEELIGLNDDEFYNLGEYLVDLVDELTNNHFSRLHNSFMRATSHIYVARDKCNEDFLHIKVENKGRYIEYFDWTLSLEEFKTAYPEYAGAKFFKVNKGLVEKME